MSLALLTHGYVCPPTDALPGGIQVGVPPTITSVVEVKPTIKHGRQTAPKIVLGVPEDV